MPPNATGSRNALADIYYSPIGYWRGLAAVPKLAATARVSEKEAQDWLKKQVLWQIYLSAPRRIPRPKFNISESNEGHQADLMFLPHDKVGRRTFKYALTIVDVASRYKEAEPLVSKSSSEVAGASRGFTKEGLSGGLGFFRSIRARNSKAWLRPS